MRRSELLGCRDAVGEQVGGDDRRRSCNAQKLHEEEAQRPAAEDPGASAGTNMPEVERVQGHAERLRERGLDVGERLGHRMQEVLGPREKRAQGPVGRAVAGEAHGRAEVLEPARADIARAARNGGIDGNALALTPAGGDDARELVPEHERMLEPGVADATLEQPVPVRAAEAHGGHAHEHLPRRRRRVRLVIQPKVVRPVQPERPQRVCP